MTLFSIEPTLKRRNKNYARWLGKHIVTNRLCKGELTFGCFVYYSEQYLELISAADAIVAMNKNAHAVLDKLDSMQVACDISTIKKRAAAVRSDQDEKGHSKEHHHCVNNMDIDGYTYLRSETTTSFCSCCIDQVIG